MMDLQKKFSEAAKTVTSGKTTIMQRVYGAYFNYLRDINADELPDKIQIIYESVTDRLTSADPASDIGYNEAAFLAKDILYMAHEIEKNARFVAMFLEPTDETIPTELRPERRRGPQDRRQLHTYVANDRRSGIADRRIRRRP
ncbi:MAG: hypothetical protein PVJ56_20015 [Desulfobacterales bacterium]|jgi:hypothetical protein